MSNVRLIKEVPIIAGVNGFTANDIFTDDFKVFKITMSDITANTSMVIQFRFVNSSGSIVTANYDRANENFRSAIDVIGSKGRIIVKGISLNTFNKFNIRNLILSKKHSEEFGDRLGPIGGMGFGHTKLLNEFLSKKFISTKDIEISKNIYLLELIHSIYNNIEKRKKFNKVIKVASRLGKK